MLWTRTRMVVEAVLVEAVLVEEVVVILALFPPVLMFMLASALRLPRV